MGGVDDKSEDTGSEDMKGWREGREKWEGRDTERGGVGR